MPAPLIKAIVTVNDSGLQRLIEQMSAATGRTVKEETRTVFKGLVRDAIRYTPPASAAAGGREAYAQGQAAISRDLNRMGFQPVAIKGYRTITQAFGRPIKPVRVPTRENPRFADPDAFHFARLQSKHGGKVSRGGRQAFYVSLAKFNAMKTRLFGEIGKLASGFVNAANELGIPVPAWIARHGGSRGTQVQIVETDTQISMRVVNYFPDKAPADEMVRRIATLKTYAVGRLERELPVILAKNLK